MSCSAVVTFSRTQADEDALARAQVDPASLVDDGKEWHGITVQKPWGHEAEVFKDEKCSRWRLVLLPNSETSMHCHTKKLTFLIVERGICMFETFTDKLTLRVGDIVQIKPGVFHRTKTIFGATLIEEEWPPNKRDLVRVDDKYGREGQGYESR